MSSVVTVVIDRLVRSPLCRRVGRRLPDLPSSSSNSNLMTSIGGGEVDLASEMEERVELDVRVLGLRLRARGLSSGSGSRSSEADMLGSSSSTSTGMVGARATLLGGGETLGSGMGRFARGGGGLDSGVDDRGWDTPKDFRMRPSCFMRVCVCNYAAGVMNTGHSAR